MTWTLIEFSGAKPHLSSAALCSPVIDDLDIRVGGQSRCTQLEPGAVHIDQGGAMLVDRTYQTVTFDGLELRVPTTELAYFLQELRAAQVRETNDIQYYKLHGWLHVVVLTPEQRDACITAWEIQLVATQADAIEEQLRFEEALRGCPGRQDMVTKGGLTPRVYH